MISGTAEEQRAYQNAASKKSYQKIKDDPEFKAGRRKRSHEQYLKNTEVLKAKAKKWRLENVEQCKEQKQLQYQQNKIEFKAKAAEWAKLNPEKRKEIQKRWWVAHPEARGIFKAKRRVQMAQVVNTLTRKQWAEILAASPMCHYCGSVFTLSLKPSLDHVIPISKSGPHTKENVVAACKSCNSQKHNFSAEEFFTRRKSKTI